VGSPAGPAYSIFVALVLGFVERIKGLRWLGKAAEIARSFATIFVVPLIALEGLDSASARRRSFQLVKENWRAESGGLGALRATPLLPGLLFYLDAKLLFSGHVHSLAGEALLGVVLLCGFGVGAAVSVIRQVFAVSLYSRRDGERDGLSQSDLGRAADRITRRSQVQILGQASRLIAPRRSPVRARLAP
jgi:hypothetical protein